MFDSGFMAFKQIEPKWYCVSMLRLLEDNAGQNVGNPANTQCIPIRDCDTDIQNYLRATGFTD